MSMILKICLQAARDFVANPTAVRKADFPSREDFDDAIDKLADKVQIDGERYYQSYSRALESPDGQLLWAARERAAIPDRPVFKREEVVFTKVEAAIDDAVARYVSEHPEYDRTHALLKVLDARPDLYRAYEKEKGRAV